jgi:hypothetical protein
MLARHRVARHIRPVVVDADVRERHVVIPPSSAGVFRQIDCMLSFSSMWV